MNKWLEQQKEKAEHLFKLIQENPDLEIMPMVATECVPCDDYGYWAGSWGKARVDEYWCDEERIYFRSHDEDSLYEDVLDSLYDEIEDEDLAEKKAKEMIEGYEWKKVIVVYIETP